MSPAACTCRRVEPAEPGISALIAAHVAHSRHHAPDTADFTLAEHGLSDPGVLVFGLYEAETALACGALKDIGGGQAEVKSVHVMQAARGKGLGRAMMQCLIDEGRRAGFQALLLETGSERLSGYEAARALYQALGFQRCGPIPGYPDDPDCAFFRLELRSGV